MEEMRNAYRIFSENFKARYLLGDISIKIKLKMNLGQRRAMDSSDSG
jgi:hypothetical protein